MSGVMADPFLVDGNWWRHEPWAVTLRNLAASSREASDALDALAAELSAEADCDDCMDRWMDEGAGGDTDFPTRLSMGDVERILSLESPELIAAELERWLEIRRDPKGAAARAAMVPSHRMQTVWEEDRQVRPADPS